MQTPTPENEDKQGSDTSEPGTSVGVAGDETPETAEVRRDLNGSEPDDGVPYDTAPAELEEELNEAGRENLTSLPPESDANLLPVVGLGGSAGSIGPLQEFFGRIPTDLGIAYVVIVHLAPDYESQLSSVLQTRTRMPVVQVQGSTEVRPNHIYVIPPARHLKMQDGHIHLVEAQQAWGKRVAVDLFFRSLAATHRSKAVAIVLSGTDGDGAIGIKRIKEHGGVTVAQDPDEAEHDGMPRSAIETGMVDWILPIEQLPGKITEWIGNENRIQLPPGNLREEVEPTPEEAGEVALHEVLVFLHTRTGHDFSHYKRATVLRRIMRRLQVNSLENIPQYVTFLRTHPGEAGALLQDLLISVTNFFRDPESFIGLSTLLPRLFRNKKPGEAVRVWVPGCATGEEAYSLAMLLDEYAETLNIEPNVQIFASDLDEQALRFARNGLYPMTIAADVSPERLRRFFVPEQGRYRVKKEMREQVLFASHNLLKDSPFSRLDLVSCRNLLIYFNREAQNKVLDVFHFALKPGGLLFLGGSESADDNQLFSVQDKKHRVYERQTVIRSEVPIPHLSPPSLPRIQEIRRLPPAPRLPGAGMEPPAISYGELHLKLLEKSAPPSILVNAHYEIMHLSEHAGEVLRFVGGEVSINLLNVVHPALRLELRMALFRAVQTLQDVDVPAIAADFDGQTRHIGLRVRPLREGVHTDDPSLFVLVIFDEQSETESSKSESTNGIALSSPPDEVARRLEEELQHSRAYLRASVEQYETSAEELKASNEELQAMNEEQRSAAEELETSREEISAVNEELTTVNHELKSKIEELSRANADLQNLMASTDIATVFLSRDLRIKRYTPRAVEMFSLIPSDIGRPLADLRHRFEVETFTVDADHVLRTLATLEREVHTLNGQWFLLRIAPYRTLEDRIDGVVLSFVDITERREAAERLHESEMRQRLMIESARDYAIFTTDLDRRVSSWNSGAQAMFGYGEEEILGQSGDILFTPEDRAARAPQQEAEKARTKGRAENERWHIRKDGSQFYGSGLVRPLRDEAENLIGTVKVMRDLTEAKRADEALRHSEERLQFALNVGGMGTFVWHVQEDRGEPDTRMLALFGLPPDGTLTLSRALATLIHPDDRASYAEAVACATSPDGDGTLRADIRIILSNGTVRWIAVAGQTLFEGTAPRRATRMSGLATNITESKRVEANLAFLADTNVDFAPLTGAEDLMQRVGARLADYFALSRCSFSIVDDQADLITTLYDWRRDQKAPSILGEHRISTFLTPAGKEQLAAGNLAVINDAQNSPRLHAPREMLDELGIHSMVEAPYLENGRWKFLLSACRSGPSVWRGDEIELIREMATRIYIRLERARAEEALRESEARFRTLSESVPSLIWANGVDGCEYVNREYLEFLGVPEAEVLGSGWARFIHPEDHDAYVSAYEAAVRQQAPFEAQFRFRRHDEYRWMKSIALPRITSAGECYGYLGSTTDVTDIKQAEEGLREWGERFRALVEQATAGVVEMDLEGNHTLVNQRFCDMLGYTEAELLGMSVHAVTHPEDLPVCLQLMEKAIKTGQPSTNEKRLLRKDGTLTWISDSISRINNAHGQAVRVSTIAIDITERKEAEAALLQAHDELEQRVVDRTLQLEQSNALLEKEVVARRQVEEAREHLLQRLVEVQEEERRRISRELHDSMGQQLTALLMMLQRLPEWPEPGPRLPSYPEQIDKLRTLATDLIHHAQRLAWEVRPATLDNIGLEAALQQHLETWSEQYGTPARFIPVGRGTAERLPTQIESALYRVVQEALTNVQRHAAAKNVSVILENDGTTIAAIVEDDGKGFNSRKESEGQSHAVQSQDGQDDEKRGSRSDLRRLGLLGMQERMELVGGTLTIESKPGHGTTLYARVPLPNKD